VKLTFIGNGNMAKALIRGLVKNYEIEVLGRNEKTLKTLKESLPQITTKIINDKEDISGKNIVLCVKPYSLPELAPKLIGKANAIFSVLAGTSIESLKVNLKSDRYIRTMPNLGASYLKRTSFPFTVNLAMSTVLRLPYSSYFSSEINSVFICEKGCGLSSPQRMLLAMGFLLS